MGSGGRVSSSEIVWGRYDADLRSVKLPPPHPFAAFTSRSRPRLHVGKAVCLHVLRPSQLYANSEALSGVVGFVRSYGKYLPEEGITLNAVCPNVLRTSISTPVFYDNLEKEGILTPMKGVVDAFASFLDCDTSGECMEVGPNGGFSAKAPAPHLDKETTRVMEAIYERSHRLHEPEQ